jgi:pimeloyl-ACP methyl ester carboxylesterase
MIDIYYESINGKNIAYKNNFSSIKDPSTTIVFLSGYLSDMNGTKSQFLYEFCTKENIGYFCFDYSGHGSSSGNVADCTISDWLGEAVTLISYHVKGSCILVGSSMGGWLAFLSALKLGSKVQGIITIAAAIDFTEKLMWDQFTKEQKMILEDNKVLEFSRGECRYNVTKIFIEDGERHLILDKKISINVPVYLLHGLHDDVVPVSISLKVAEQLDSQSVQIIISKSSDHRMSSKYDLSLLDECLRKLLQVL